MTIHHDQRAIVAMSKRPLIFQKGRLHSVAYSVGMVVMDGRHHFEVGLANACNELHGWDDYNCTMLLDIYAFLYIYSYM